MPDDARSHIVTVTQHTGPVLACCPVDCLRLVIRGAAFNVLARAYDAPFDSPQTAGDVVGLYEQGRLGEIRGLGPRLLARITAGLAEAGLT